jgi:hypothetical protein
LTGAEDIFYIPVNGTNATFRIENEATSTSSLAIYQITTRTTNPVSVLGTPYAPNTATAITGSGFNASWNTVPNASGYLVRTYSTLGTLRNTFAVSGGSTTSYAVTGIDTVKVGTYKVVATGDYITYSNSNISPASTPYAITRLATPVIGVGSGATASGFTANWSTVVNASSYDVLVYQGATLISTTNAAGEATITVDITGLSEYTPYTYTVIAKGDGATYFDSYPSTASASISTLRNLPKVATPAIGTASSVLATGFTANWTVVDNAASYNISVYQGVTFIKTVNASGQATASVAITGLTAGLAYTYKMVAVGDGATYDDSVVSDASAIVTTNILATPTIGTASAVTATGFTANWTAVADASSYSVILYSGINAIDTKSAVGQSIQSIDFTGLTSGFSYTYKVQAIGDGTTYASSGVSTASASVTTNKLIAPAIGTVSDINATGFTANWTAVANAVSYDVKVYNSGATLISTTNITGEASNSLAITGLSNFTIYNYKVTAIGDVNYANSDISSVSANFITLDPAAVNTISTNFNDGTWGTPLASVPTVSGTFGSSTVNGFTLTNTCLTESSAKGPKGESHTNRISFDKQNTGAMVTLPTLNSVSQIEIHATSGSAGNGFFLQEYVPSSNSWVAVGANYVYELASKNSGLDSIYIIPISRNVQTKFRIGNFASGSLNLYQVITRTTNPALLARPTVNAASGITGSGFTASWIPVTYATGYKVKVYKSSTAGVASSTVRNTYTVSGQATSSYAVVNADTALNALTYKVQAIGNADVDYSDSYNSSASAGFYISKSATTIAIGNEVDASTLGGTSANQDVTIPGTSTLTTVSAPVTVNTVTFEAGAKLNLTNALTVAGDLTFKSDNSSSFSANLGTSHITVTGNVSYVKYMDDMTWYFMAFPVPMVVANIKDAVTGTPLSASGELIIKYYDSALRSSAGATGTNWITVATGATLEAKKGYIFGIKGISKGGLANNYNVKFPLPSTIVSAGETDGATVPVEAYTGGAADNNGWNLIGQPFLSTYSGADATGAGVGLNYLNIPDATGATYSQTAKGAAMINPFQAYFVQATGAGDISFGTNGRQGVKSTVETDLSEQVQINFTSATGTDKTNLIMDNNQSTAYEIGQDLAKMLGTGTAKPQIYSILGDVNYAYNALPMSSVSNLPIGVYTQTAGTTTISADATLAPSLSSLILLDNSNGLSYDLLEGSFSFEAIAGYSSTTRFSITAQRVATENLIQSVNDGLNLISVNGKLMLNNNAGTTTIRVFDAIGRIIANKTTNNNSLEIPLVAKGMYTIQVESGAKIWTKKIVNQ